jgi:D-alanine-D-alanine ligase
VIEADGAARRVAALVRDGYDLFFNLCDGARGQDEPGIEVVRTLERLGAAFTGATSAFYEPTRAHMKRVCRALRIATPAHAFVKTAADVRRAARTLRFPMIVKHPSSYASIGLSRASRVVTPAGLRRQAAKMVRRFGSALVEEFIEGRECTVLVAEDPQDPRRPKTYTPIEYRFPEGETFKHERLKWVDYGGVVGSPVADPALAAALCDLAARLFVGLSGTGFGRCDVRVDAEGTPYLLEINANCGVYYPPTDPGSADLCLLNDREGHAGFTRRLVEAGLRRRRPRARVASARAAP